MKQKSKHIAAVLLAIVMVFSTISLTMHHWYCQGNLVETTLYSATGCCDLEDNEGDLSITESCCEHEAFVIQGQDELQLQNEYKTYLKKQFFVTENASFVLQILKTHTKKVVSKKQYLPPTIIIDKLSTYQVFLI